MRLNACRRDAYECICVVHAWVYAYVRVVWCLCVGHVDEHLAKVSLPSPASVPA